MRKFWYWLFGSIINLFVSLKVSPNCLSILSLIFCAFSTYLFASGYIVWGAWLLILSGAFDSMDGRVARKRNMATKAGSFLDSSIDRFSDNMIYLGIMYFLRNDTVFFLILSLIIISSNGISYFKAKAESLGVKMDDGLMQRPERIWIICMTGVFAPIIALFFQYYGFTSLEIITIFKVGLVVLAFGSFWTAMHRFFKGFYLLKDQKE
jgi:CDP-diacylglycerol--glycerol-3-phosphate 3-phosphatidyltransferase